MRRAVLAIVSTVTGLVFLLSFKTHGASVGTPPAAIASPTPGSGSTGSAAKPTGSSSGSAAGSAPTKSPTRATSRTVTGAIADTPYGPVQVRITVRDGRITAVTAAADAADPRSQQINAYALPQLYQETLAADSANIDMISGATYTSEGYVTSLQSALNKAGL